MMFFFYASPERASEVGSYSMFFSSPQKFLLAKKLLILNSPVRQKALEKTVSDNISAFLTNKPSLLSKEGRRFTEHTVETIVNLIHHMVVDTYKAGYSCLNNVDDIIVHISIQEKDFADITVVFSRFECEEEKCPYYYPWEEMCSIEDESDMPCIYHINYPPQ